MTAVERTILEKFKALISARGIRLCRLILFGSRARGDADPHSDLDVLVVVEGSCDEGTRTFVSDCAWEAGFEQGIVVVPVVFTRDEWERGPERHSLFVRAVEKEGIPL